ncbi:hypothetical protein VMCG_08748 [Cytospora schulzeri]|uniref:Uncharacterized protein n=1 Tax=Cytospora schulzeri TaxID=448051 RepID=A0A423VQ80_9PEZI|nr:hypothetical protein VMCG_08748 [Valsa malicola]
MWHALTGSDWATDIVQAMFSNALLSALSPAVIEKTQDSYENIKVPMLEALDGYEDGGWITLSDTSKLSVTYASLIGLPFGPKPSSENTSFTLSTSYLSLDYPVFRIDSGQCEDLYKANRTLADAFLRTADPLHPSTNNWTFTAGPQSDTDVMRDIACDSGFLLGVSTCSKGCAPTQASWDARKIAWSSTSTIGFAHVECNIRTSYADVDYSCVKGSCQSQRARRTPDPPHDANVTAFDMNLGSMASSMIFHLASMYPFVDSGASTPVMQYILSPSEALTRYVRQDNVSIIDVGRKQFEIRLGQLINTIYLIGVSPTVMSGGTPIDQANVNPSPGMGYDYQFLNTTRVVSTTSSVQDLLRCNKAWFSVLIVASTISLAAAIASIVIRSRALLPDVLGTLSLATLKTVSTGGSTLDGMERARRLKSVGVRMGDIEPTAIYGRIALAAPSTGDEIRSLEKWRLYE